jgi:hypothetical protein
MYLNYSHILIIRNIGGDKPYKAMGNVKNMPNTNMDILEEVSLPLLCF